MKILYLFLLAIICPTLAFAQSGQWVWMKGDSTFNIPFSGNFGKEHPSYHPPSLYLAGSWTDDSGYLYLVDGMQYNKFFGEYYYDGIWRFNTKTNNWKLIKTSPFINSYGIYGIKGVPDTANYPGARAAPIIWKDHEGYVWLFGGHNPDGTYNDLWKYDEKTNEWTWMNGPNGTGIFDYDYGTKGVPSPDNVPPPRGEAASWIDDSDNLWLFGGLCPSCNGSTMYEDLWKYNTKINEWTWVGGRQQVNDEGHYGIKGVPDTSNLPPGRACRCSWTDDSDNLYLYGGDYLYSQSYVKGDLWKYNPKTQEWTWLEGPRYWDSIGTFGRDCIYSKNNEPTTKSEEVCLKSKKLLWLFSGLSKESTGNTAASRDMWTYNLKLSSWTRLWGDDADFSGNYGQKRVIENTNDPRGRYGAVGWFDNNGNLWFYGGNWGIYEYAEGDLWKYIPDSTCGITTSSISIQQQDKFQLYPNPAYDELTVSFPFSNNIITIYDLCGRELKEWKMESGKLKMVDVSFLQQGVYVVEIKDEKGVLIASEKLFKE